MVSAGAGGLSSLRSARERLVGITVDWAAATPKQFRDLLRAHGYIVVENGPRTPEDSINIVKTKLGAEIIPSHFGVIEGQRAVDATHVLDRRFEVSVKLSRAMLILILCACSLACALDLCVNNTTNANTDQY
jgi:hypothetical protein